MADEDKVVPSGEPIAFTNDEGTISNATGDAYEDELDKLLAAKQAAKAKSDDGDADTATAERSGGEKPTDRSADEVKKEPAKEAAKKEEVAGPTDEEILAAMPEAVREAAARRFKDAEDARKEAAQVKNDNKSLAGRMAAYQRRYETAAGIRPPDPAEKVAAAAAAESATLKQFAEDYPDIAAAMKEMITSAKPGATSSEVVEFVQEQRRERFLTDAWAAVEAARAGARDLAGTEEFVAWKDAKPAYQRLASSDDVDDAITLFELWDAQHPAQGEDVGAAETAKREAAEAAKLAAKRAAQVKGGAAPTAKAATPNHGVDLNDPDQLWAFYADKANKRMQARNK